MNDTQVQTLVHFIADAIIRNESSVFSARDLRRIANNLIVNDDPEPTLRRAIDWAVKTSPVATLRCPLAKALIAQHNLLLKARNA